MCITCNWCTLCIGTNNRLIKLLVQRRNCNAGLPYSRYQGSGSTHTGLVAIHLVRGPTSLKLWKKKKCRIRPTIDPLVCVWSRSTNTIPSVWANTKKRSRKVKNSQYGQKWVRKVYHGVRKVYHGVRKVYHGVRKFYHGVRKVYNGHTWGSETLYHPPHSCPPDPQ